MSYLGYCSTTVLLFAITVSLNLYKKEWIPSTLIDSDLQSDLGGVINMFLYYSDGNYIDFKNMDFQENLNANGLAEKLYYSAPLRLHESWIPMILQFNDDGNFVDKQGNPIQVLVFSKKKVNKKHELSQLSKDYKVAAWSLGRDGINEFGFGDDVFVGLRWSGEFNSQRVEPSWWRVWRN